MRYYSSTSGAMTLTANVGAGATVLPVNTTVGLPASYPYTLVVEPGVAGQEEIVTVTAAAGSNLTVVRGEDSTTGVTHSLGTPVRHMLTARDLRESRQHEDSSAGVHGVTGELVGDTDTQTLDNKTFQADADHTALTVRAAVGQTTPAIAIKSSAGTTVWSLGGGSGIDSDAVALRTASTAVFWGSAVSVTTSNGVDGVLVNFATGTTGYGLKVQKAGVNKALIDLNGNATLAAVVATTGAFSGAITSPTITALAAADTAHTAADAALDVRLDAIEANLGAQTTFAATSAAKSAKKLHWGAYSGTTDGSSELTVTHGCGFTPTVVVPVNSVVSSNQVVSVHTITATTCELVWRTAGGAALTSNAVSAMVFFGE